MRVLIVIESIYGTNRRIAEAVAAGLGERAEVTIVEAHAAPTTVDPDVDLLVVGGPNHKSGLPRPGTRAEATARDDANGADHQDTEVAAASDAGDGPPPPVDRGLREWLDDLTIARPGQPAAVWDTRMASPRILDLVDHSGRSIAKGLRRAGVRLVAEPQRFYSADGKGALVEGEEERARTWGATLAGLPLSA
jgi:hypothetical protein